MSRSENSRRKQTQRMLRARQKRLGQRDVARATAGGPAGRFKMSEVIGHLAEPLVEQLGDTPEDVERVIMMTIVAWNLSLFPPEQREVQLRKAVQKFFPRDEEAQHVMTWAWDLVLERKRKYYPNLRHFIVDVRFEREPDDTVYFEVAYTLEESTAP